jgi:hypothetical protein
MSDYYEYYHNNPHELPPLTDAEYEEQLHEEIVAWMDDAPSDYFLDFSFGKGKEEIDATLNAIKRMAIAHYNEDDKELLVFAKYIAKKMVDGISNYVEREKM